MGPDSEDGATLLIDRAAPRGVFAELVAGALSQTRVAPSSLAVAYLIELLESRVTAPGPAEAADATLGEGLLQAQLQHGVERLQRLRRLGDRALFVAGFFGDSLNRSLVGVEYYGDVGRTAYANLARALAAQLREQTWPGLYAELAQHFHDFVEVLAEVGDRTRADGPGAMLRLYERYLRTGSSRDRRRLMRRGQVPPEVDVLRRWQ